MTWEMALDLVLTVAFLLLLGTEILLAVKAWKWIKKKLGFKTTIFKIEEKQAVEKK